MNTRLIALAVIATLSSGAARATTYFDTITSPNPADLNAGADGPSDGAFVMAQSFTAGTFNSANVTLNLSADTPTDGGSIMVYLVPDDGTGGATGRAGSPLIASDGNGNVLGFTPDAVQIGSLQDAALPSTGANPSTFSFWISPAAAASVYAASGGPGGDDEYWIGLVASGDSSAEWYSTAPNSGLGYDGQAYFNDIASNGGSTFSPDVSGSYEMTVTDAPEPASFALLGGALAGIGFVRRRSARSA